MRLRRAALVLGAAVALLAAAAGEVRAAPAAVIEVAPGEGDAAGGAGYGSDWRGGQAGGGRLSGAG